jgi:hypothetical protein
VLPLLLKMIESKEEGNGKMEEVKRMMGSARISDGGQMKLGLLGSISIRPSSFDHIARSWPASLF